MKIKQLSIFLENKTGRWAHITKILADAEVNLLALSLADTTDFGILRMIVSDPETAVRVLKEQNVVTIVNEVTAVEVDDQPGGLARILDALEGQNANVEYMYAFASRPTHRAALIFRFDDPERAVALLREAGINVFKEMDLF